MKRGCWLLLTGVFVVALTGCRNPISKELRSQAQPVAPPNVVSDPNAMGKTVVWGGRIIDTKKTSNGVLLYVMERPLTHSGRPESRGVWDGRFIAEYDGTLDPRVYGVGNDVTVGGRITGISTEPMGSIQYPYPVVSVHEVYLWPTPGGDKERFPRTARMIPSWAYGYHDGRWMPSGGVWDWWWN